MFKVYATKTCLYCKRAEELLTLNNLPYEKIYIDEDSKAKEFITEQGYKTVPQIWYSTTDNDEYVGGYRELVPYVNSKKGTASLV
tara:strand:- start:269 stop:523 length:255 start_codon:yes stop_codon:yes gene_type:complete